MSKARDAFRTISEVAEWMETPAHVLRFWESKFSQVKPVKRAGGRRYYRPADMELLGGIKKLLHDEGMTIKGVQKVLRDQGIAHVASLSTPVKDTDVIADAPFIEAPEATDSVVPFPPNSPDNPPGAEHQEPDITAEDLADLEALDAPQEDPAEPDSDVEPHQAQQPEFALEPLEPRTVDAPVPEPETQISETQISETLAPETLAPETPATETPAEDPERPAQRFAEDAAHSPIPSFLRQPLSSETPQDAPEAAASETRSSPAIPDDPDLSAIQVMPGALTALGGLSHLSATDAAALRPVVEQLRAVQDRLVTQRRS